MEETTIIITFLSIALTVWAIPYLVMFFDARAEKRQKQKKYLTRFYKESELRRFHDIEKMSIRHLEEKGDYSKN